MITELHASVLFKAITLIRSEQMYLIWRHAGNCETLPLRRNIIFITNKDTHAHLQDVDLLRAYTDEHDRVDEGQAY